MAATAAPIVIFGDLDADVWGVVLGGDRPQVAVAGLSDAEVALEPADLDLEDAEVWMLSGPGCALRVERAQATTATADGDRSLEPCRVSGSVKIGVQEREFDVGGVRSTALTLDGLDSLRLLGTWFPAGHEIALVSARPAGAKGHDRDSVTVIARGEEKTLVIDPRLSTTYGEHGQPRRVGVELWLGDDEEGELWPRRVAGSATGSSVADAGLSAHALRCGSRGEAGAGVFVVLRRAG